MKIIHAPTKKEIAAQVKVVNGFFDRLVGLMFKKDMRGFDGLLIDPCNSIHTCFMRYSLDIIFLNDHNEIIKIVRNIKPWRMTRIYFNATKVLELKSGVMDSQFCDGDKLEVVCTN